MITNLDIAIFCANCDDKKMIKQETHGEIIYNSETWMCDICLAVVKVEI